MLRYPTPRSTNRGDRLRGAQLLCGSGGKIFPPDRATALLEAVIELAHRTGPPVKLH